MRTIKDNFFNYLSVLKLGLILESPHPRLFSYSFYNDILHFWIQCIRLCPTRMTCSITFNPHYSTV